MMGGGESGPAGGAAADRTSPEPSRRLSLVAGSIAALIWSSLSACGPGTPDGGPGSEGSFGGTLDCRQRPRFAAEAGFTTGSALSTGAGERPGLALVDVTDPTHIYQHPSWVRHGYLGPFTFDAEGNVYVAPTPNFSLLENPPEEQNTIYRVNTDSGEMESFARLEPAGPVSPENPFGILGLTYDCPTDGLYVSSVAGSSRRSEIGRIVRVDPADGEVVDSVENIDAMGLAVFRGRRDTRLYFGTARKPEVWSVALDERGGFLGPARRELALPGWSDKARRIEFDTEGRMTVLGVPFVFNLAVGADAVERTYGFTYDPAEDRWQLETTP